MREGMAHHLGESFSKIAADGGSPRALAWREDHLAFDLFAGLFHAPQGTGQQVDARVRVNI